MKFRQFHSRSGMKDAVQLECLQFFGAETNLSFLPEK